MFLQLQFYLDETYVNEMATRSEVQLLSRGEMFLGGIHHTRTETGGVVTTNFDGAFSDVMFKYLYSINPNDIYY